MARRTPIYGIDPERGDQFTRLRETSIELVEFGFEIYASIAWAFERYMAGKPGDPIPELDHIPEKASDPYIIKMMTGTLMRLIEHQKQNTRNHIERSSTNKRAADIRWGKRDAFALPENANASQNDANAPDKDIVEAQAQSLRASINDIDVGPSGVADVVPPGGGTSARVVVDEYSNPNVEYRESEIFINPVAYIYKFAVNVETALCGNPTKDELFVFNRTLKKRFVQMKRMPGLFERTCFDVISEYCKLTHEHESLFIPNTEGCVRDESTFKAIESKLDDVFGEHTRRTILGRLKDAAIELGLADS